MIKFIKKIFSAIKTFFSIISNMIDLLFIIVFLLLWVGSVLLVIGGTLYVLFAPISDPQFAEYSSFEMVAFRIFAAIFYFIISSAVCIFGISAFSNTLTESSSSFSGSSTVSAPKEKKSDSLNLVLTALAAFGLYQIFKKDD